jgi:DNA repair exonuclease SbcCD ATPase subunit
MELTRLILKNFRTHKSKLIEFKEGVTAIIGGNGTGKSSIVEAIIFLLTGEGYGKKADMLSLGQTSGYVIGHMLIDGKEAILERHVDTAKVNFSYDGKVYKKSGEVNEIWESLFQIDKNIVQNVIVSNQGEISMLFNGDNATKEKLFQKIFMVPNTTKIRDTIWNNYIKDAPPEYPVKDLVELNSEIQCIEELVRQEQEECDKVIIDENEYTKLIARQAFLHSIEEAQKTTVDMRAALPVAESKVAEAEETCLKISERLKAIDIDTCRDTLAALKASKPMHIAKLALEERKRDLHVPKLVFGEKEEALLSELETKEQGYRVLADLKNKQIADIDLKIRNYHTNLEGDTCPTCGSSIDPEKLIAHLTSEKQPLVDSHLELLGEMDTLRVRIGKGRQAKQESDKYKAELAEIEASFEAIKHVQFDQSEYDLWSGVVEKYGELELKAKAALENQKKAENELNRLKLTLAGQPTYDKDPVNFTSEVIVVRENIANFQAQRAIKKDLELTLAGKTHQLKRLREDLEDSKAHEEKNSKRKKYMNVLKGIYDLFHTGKFPRALIQTYSSTVSEYMTEVLHSFDFPYTAKVNETFGIDIFNDEGLQLPSISGGQQVMVGFSLRLALHNMFVGAFPLMIVDEGSYGLSGENAIKYFEIIRSLGKGSKFKQVIVIDHHSELSDYVDNTITL